MKIFYIALFLLLSSVGYSQSPCPGLDSINYSGKWYHTVQIGSQCWLKENLNVGTMVPAVKDQINNDTIEKFCYNNDPGMCDIYGGLYQWREAMQYTMKNGAKGICPVGWHVPSFPEYDTLVVNTGSDGNALKMIGQGGGTNTSGFSALLAGIDIYTSFNNIGKNAYFLSCCNTFYRGGDVGDGVLYVKNITLGQDQNIYIDYPYAVYGYSIRCIKDKVDLLLLSPYGSEIWQTGSNHKISWGGSNLTDTKIKIEYTTDNGTHWLEITGSTSAIDGEYNWTIPNTPSKTCKVKISDLDNTNNISISDTLFTIYKDPCPAATIVHGGKIYNTVTIAGRCFFKENVNIGTMILGSQQAVSNCVIEKYCYNDDTANCSIYGGLYSYSETGESGYCPTFWSAQGINGLVGNVIYDGNALKAVGQGSGFGSGSNTSGFSALLAGYRGTDGTFQNLGTGAYFPYSIFSQVNNYVKTLSGNNSNISWTDHWQQIVGSSYRCIRNEVGPLHLNSPSGGENWQIGTTQSISWALSDVINIRIDYTTNNGTSWINIIASTPTSAGSYQWTIPNTPSTNCKVKISSINNSDTNSISNSFQIYQVPTNPCPGIPTVNYAGKTYNTIAIGDQCWMRENLNIGTMINGAQNDSDNGIIEKYCYNNDSVKCDIYGGLYQWDETMQYDTTEGAIGICPAGWHVPTWNDYSILKANVGNRSNDLKELGQGTGSGIGTNSSGFSALLAGICYNGTFYYLNAYADFWTSRKYDNSNSYDFYLVGSTNIIQGSPVDKLLGGSIRCINNLTISELPVELTTFKVFVANNNINLTWNTATEVNTSSFNIEKKLSNSDVWQKIASVKASGNSSSPKQYSYIDKNVNTGKYNYRLKMLDLDGTSKYSNTITAEVIPPVRYELSNAYPNPWNPTTTIRYQIPINILVTIKVFDALGREVTTLVNEVKPIGSYEVAFSGKDISSGVYYYQMKAGSFFETKKFILIK